MSPADTDYAIHELLAGRYSPYLFDPRPVETPLLQSCFEAARWAASSYNEQPWRFLLATRDDGPAFERMLGCLVEPNRGWAKNAGAIALATVSRTFAQSGKMNGAAEHDLGLAVAALTVQASTFGLQVHQMGGILPEVCRETYTIPEGHDPAVAFAVGYAANPDAADGEYAGRDRGPRSRRPLTESLFGGGWGRPHAVLGEAA